MCWLREAAAKQDGAGSQSPCRSVRPPYCDPWESWVPWAGVSTYLQTQLRLLGLACRRCATGKGGIVRAVPASWHPALPGAFDYCNFINANLGVLAEARGCTAHGCSSPSAVPWRLLLQMGLVLGGADPKGDLLSAASGSRQELHPSKEGPVGRCATQRMESWWWCKGWVFSKHVLGDLRDAVGVLGQPCHMLQHHGTLGSQACSESTRLESQGCAGRGFVGWCLLVVLFLCTGVKFRVFHLLLLLSSPCRAPVSSAGALMSSWIRAGMRC